jgi:predicted 3-demethylubiquinone-9 3-methyltransferase (glyoxalase superfamily)
MMTDADGDKADRIMNAVLKMKKFDIAELKNAFYQ